MTRIKKYSVKEAAEILHVDPQQLYRQALANKIPHEQVGLDIRFTASNIELIRASINEAK